VAILLFSVDGRRQIVELAKADSPRFAIGKKHVSFPIKRPGHFYAPVQKMCIKEGNKWAKTDCLVLTSRPTNLLWIRNGGAYSKPYSDVTRARRANGRPHMLQRVAGGCLGRYLDGTT